MTIFTFLKNIIQLILSPVNAWKDIEREDVPVEKATTSGLYPLMAVMLLTVFLRPVYGLVEFDLINLLQIALIQFVALYVALFAGRNVMERYLPAYNSTGANDPIAVGNVAVYGTGLMTVIQIIENLMPIDLPILQLLPAFAAICIWESHQYLDIKPKRETPFMLLSVVALIAPVILINLVMSYVIN